jgi:uncharacterized membrane protein YidH (DUF202 family)
MNKCMFLSATLILGSIIGIIIGALNYENENKKKRPEGALKPYGTSLVVCSIILALVSGFWLCRWCCSPETTATTNDIPLETPQRM